MNDELIAQAEIGEAARVFLASELGRVLVGMAKQEYQLALEDLAKVDVNRPLDVQRLQNRAELYSTFEQWLAELVDKGDAAIQIFRQQEQDA